MTLNELLKELNDFFTSRPIYWDLEIDKRYSRIEFKDGFAIDWLEDEEEDYYPDDCDYECSYDPYAGCYTDDC